MAEISESLLTAYVESDGLALAELIRRGEISAAEALEAAIVTVERLNPRLNAVVHKLYDSGRAAVGGIDRDAPFAGVPFLIKELSTSWKGAPNTKSSFYLKDVVADFDSEVATRIKRAGFVMFGKTNAPENGWAITTEPKLYGATVNPWNAAVTAGGSSGGAAAAVASRMVALAEATDAAGSIRVPASCCGVVGLKPSRGRVTQAPASDVWYGGACVLANTRTVRDTAAYLDALAGALPGDPYPPPRPESSWLELARVAPQRLRIGYTLTHPQGLEVDAEVRATVLETVRRLEGLGHHVEEHALAFDAERAWQTHCHIGCVQAAAAYSAFAALVGRPVTERDVEPITWALLQRGRGVSGMQHYADVQAARAMGRAFAGDLHRYDAFLTPTLTQLPRPVGFYDMSETDLDLYHAKWSDAVFAFPLNMSGLPAISLPLGMSLSGVPIGVQAIGRYGDEATLLSLASVLEQEMPWSGRRPPVSA